MDDEELEGFGRRGRDSRILSRIAQRENGGTCILVPPVAPATVLPEVTGPILQLSGENADAPETMTVTLYRDFLEPLEPTYENSYTGALYARVTWGAGKTHQSLLCDFHHGARLTLDASSVEVEAIYTSYDGGDLIGPPIRFSASLVYGNIGNRQLTFTERLTLGSTASLMVTIPSFAGRLTQVGGGPVAATGQWHVNRTANLGRPVTLIDGSAVEIPNGAEYIEINNPSLASQDYQLIWGLNV